MQSLQYDDINFQLDNTQDPKQNANQQNQNTTAGENPNDKIQDIKQMGVPNMPPNSPKEIQCITIIGEIEGHFAGNPQKKSTKYEHIIPMLYSVEESSEIKGIISPVAGNADVIIFPNIESGNTFYKTISRFANATTAGWLEGTDVSVVVSSRADSVESKYFSLALACFLRDRKSVV